MNERRTGGFLSFIITVELTGCAIVVLVHLSCNAHLGKFYIHEPILYILIFEIVLTRIILAGGILKGWHELRQQELVMTIPRTTLALFPSLLDSRQVTIVLGSFKAALDAELHNIPHT